MQRSRILILLAAVLLPGAVLAPVWSLRGLGAGEDDILYYYPARVFLHETLQAGEAPWLNPWNGLGRPFVADPQTAIWYPFTWLFAVLPPLWAYPVSLWAHYSLALWGMYRLLRALRLDRRAALFGGVAFAFCGFMLAHRAHLTMPHAAAWAPWVLWRLHVYAAHDSNTPPSGGAGRLWYLVWAVGALAMQCLAGHTQIAALTAVGSLVFLLACKPRGAAAPAFHRRWRPVATRWLVAWVCAAGVFAIQWLPTLAYLRLCTRTSHTYGQFIENSWHPVSALGWLLPMLLGQRTPNFFDQAYWGPSHQVEQFAYAGLLPLALAALALRRGWWTDPQRRPWVILGAFGLLLGLGKYGPLCPVLYWLPGGSLFRCPARALLLFNIAVAGLAAVTVHELGAGLSPRRVRLRAATIRWTRRPWVLSVVLIVAPLAVLLIAMPFLGAEPRAAAWQTLRPWNPAVCVPLLAAWLSLTVLGYVARRWQQPRRLWLLVAVTVVDLGVIGWTIDVPGEWGNPRALVTPSESGWMDAVRRSPYRLWVVTGRQGRNPGEYIVPVDKAVANTNILRGIASLSDYGPLQPRGMVERFGFQPWGESWAAQALLSDTRWMRLYNVGWILLCDAHWPAPAGCDLVKRTSAGWRLYCNPCAEGYALFEEATQPGAVHVVHRGPAAMTVRADAWPMSTAPASAPGPRVVISQLALPGWCARMNAREVPLETVDGLLLGVRVPPGKAVEIDLTYAPPGLVPGALISLLCVMVLIGAGVISSFSVPRAGLRQRPAHAERATRA